MKTMFGVVVCALLLASNATAAVARDRRGADDAPCSKFEYCSTCYDTLADAVGAIPCRYMS